MCEFPFFTTRITLENADFFLLSRSCQECDCDSLGSVDSYCNQDNGKCRCHPNVVGDRCSACAEGFYDFNSGKGCKPCNCDVHGTVDASLTCGHDGQCYCKPGRGGLQCNECSPGFYGDPASGCYRECSKITDSLRSKIIVFLEKQRKECRAKRKCLANRHELQSVIAMATKGQSEGSATLERDIASVAREWLDPVAINAPGATRVRLRSASLVIPVSAIGTRSSKSLISARRISPKLQGRILSRGCFLRESDEYSDLKSSFDAASRSMMNSVSDLSSKRELRVFTESSRKSKVTYLKSRRSSPRPISLDWISLRGKISWIS